MKVYVCRRRPDRLSAWLDDAGFTIEQTLLNPDDAFREHFTVPEVAH